MDKNDDSQITMEAEFIQGEKKVKFQVTLPRDTLLFSSADEIVAAELKDDVQYAPPATLALKRPNGLEPLVFELVHRWQLVGR